ncbi:MAG: hypothetical protein JJT94_14050 [Bernardetiaceae bacterium]|nr:hypothetical protein [Bernardetiaceae bacterium]
MMYRLFTLLCFAILLMSVSCKKDNLLHSKWVAHAHFNIMGRSMMFQNEVEITQNKILYQSKQTQGLALSPAMREQLLKQAETDAPNEGSERLKQELKIQKTAYSFQAKIKNHVKWSNKSGFFLLDQVELISNEGADIMITDTSEYFLQYNIDAENRARFVLLDVNDKEKIPDNKHFNSETALLYISQKQYRAYNKLPTAEIDEKNIGDWKAKVDKKMKSPETIAKLRQSDPAMGMLSGIKIRSEVVQSIFIDENKNPYTSQELFYQYLSGSGL